MCRTDLHLIDGDLPDPKLPIVPGHEIVGRVAALGEGVTQFALGERVGVPWLGRHCGACPYCRMGRESLCDAPGFTGYTIDGHVGRNSTVFPEPGGPWTLTACPSATSRSVGCSSGDDQGEP